MQRLRLILLLAALGACKGEDRDGDGLSGESDCNDDNPEIGGPVRFYGDADGDGVAGELLQVELCAIQDGYHTEAGDCDDLDPTVFPGAPEVCDGQDNDCDELVDDGDDDWDRGSGGTFFADGDGDGYGAFGAVEHQACLLPEGMAASLGDCDDADPLLHPATVWHADFDGDGYGSQVLLAVRCEQPAGYLLDGQDCDDLDAWVNPEGLEVCDGVDNDCDGLVDDDDDSVDLGLGLEFWPDLDGDGYSAGDGDPVTACAAPEGYGALTGDCDDEAAAVNPGELEVCGDGLDNDCDGGAGVCELKGVFGAVADGDVHWRGVDSSDEAGRSLAVVPDLDGDGADEVLVGAAKASGTYRTAGAVYLLPGSDELGGELLMGEAPTFEGSEDYAYLGHSVAVAGDLDGDGFTDLALGAYAADGGGLKDAGIVYLAYGSASAWSGTLDVASVAQAVDGAQAYQELGSSLSALGDLDGDGLADLAMGAGEHDATSGGEGAVYLLYGATSRAHLTSEMPVIIGSTADDKLGDGPDVAVGDFDGDGFDDLALGAPGRDFFATLDVGVFGVLLDASARLEGELLFSDLDQSVRGDATSGDGYFGHALVGGQDLDDDGYEDLVAGAYLASHAEVRQGAVYLFPGGPDAFEGVSTAAGASLMILGDASTDFLGHALSAAGDLDEDGVADLAIGAFGWGDGGAAFVLFGSPGLSGSLAASDLALRVEGDDNEMELGYTVRVGDIDGNGAGDLLMGAVEDTDGTGGLYGHFGGGL